MDVLYLWVRCNLCAKAHVQKCCATANQLDGSCLKVLCHRKSTCRMSAVERAVPFELDFRAEAVVSGTMHKP